MDAFLILNLCPYTGLPCYGALEIVYVYIITIFEA